MPRLVDPAAGDMVGRRGIRMFIFSLCHKFYSSNERSKRVWGTEECHGPLKDLTFAMIVFICAVFIFPHLCCGHACFDWIMLLVNEE